MTIPSNIQQEFNRLLDASREGRLDTRKQHRLDQLMKLYPGLQDYYVDYMLLCLNLHTYGPLSKQAQSDLTQGILSASSMEPMQLDDRRDVGKIKQYAERQLREFLAQQEKLRQASRRPGHRHSYRPQIDLKRLGRRMNTALTWGYRSIVIGALATAAVLLVAVRVGIHRANRVVATLEETQSARWAEGSPEKQLRAGWLVLQEGFARIVMNQGAEVLLQAPCLVELCSANELFLQSGSVCARVPRQANGFTVNTPESRVVDFGTEFGVIVGSAKRTEVHVFKGRVGLGDRVKPGGSALQSVTAGQAAWMSSGSDIQIQAIDERPSLFARNIPEGSGLGIPGKRIDLADLIGGGNGFGTGRQGQGIDPSNGQITPTWHKTGARTRHFVPLPASNFIDGVFIPDGGRTGRAVVSSTGLEFRDCPDTNGGCHDGLTNGARYKHGENPVHIGQLQGRVYGTDDYSSIGMHANTGVTFDLQTIHRAMPEDQRISRFKALCGVSETVAWYSDGYYGSDHHRVLVDFWVLVDGQLKFHRTLAAVPSEPVAIDLELPPSARFLTLMTTGHQMDTSFCWGMYAEPALELEVRQVMRIGNWKIVKE